MQIPSRVLLLEDDSDYRRLVQAALAGSAEAFEVRSAASLAEGLAEIDAFAPDVILVDLNLTDSSGYGTFLRVRERAPGVPIVVLTGLDDDTAAIRAVEDGAQDYLVKSQLQPTLIGRAVRIAASRQSFHQGRGRRGGRAAVLAFIGSKGGVGTSTVAANVAALLAGRGSEGLLIELECGRRGTASLYMDSERGKGLLALREKAAITEVDIRDCAAPTPYGVHLLCAETCSFGEELSGAQAQAIIAAGRRAFPHVVVDLPPRLDRAAFESIRLADSATVVVDREAASLHSAKGLIAEIAAFREGDVRVALVDRTPSERSLPLAEVRSYIRLHPVVIIPAAAPAIALSHSARTPAALLFPEQSFSLAHAELVEQLVPGWALGRGACGGERSGARGAFQTPIPETLFG
jgi:CheY-like chemotaxis protein/MinD-like ATPase involved in chromosome partitioning or flagellar assembly